MNFPRARFKKAIGKMIWKRIRSSLRSSAELGMPEFYRKISDLRSSISRQYYGKLIAAIRANQPKKNRNLFSAGIRFPDELIGLEKKIATISIADEIAWAGEWLSTESERLNRIRSKGIDIQENVLRGHIENSIALVDAFIQSNGWSLWAFELRCALTALHNPAELSEWGRGIGAIEKHPLTALFGYIIMWRNDHSYSYEAFHKKSVEALPELASAGDWVPDYFLYRGLKYAVNPQRSYANVLAHDLGGTLVDYYESFIWVCRETAVDGRLKGARSGVSAALTQLLKSGCKDHRLKKILLLIEPESIVELLPAPNFQSATSKFYAVITGVERDLDGMHGPVLRTLEQLIDRRDRGVTAELVGAEIARFGVNLNGLDIGPAVSASYALATCDPTSDSTLTAQQGLVVPGFDPAMIGMVLASGSVEKTLGAWLRKSTGRTDEDSAQILLAIRDPRRVTLATPRADLRLWLAGYLVKCGRDKEACRVAETLTPLGGYWERQSDKIRIVAYARSEDLFKSLDICVKWILRSPSYASELPLDNALNGVGWRVLRNLDSVTVALVSHYSYLMNSAQSTRFLCRMACRAIAAEGVDSLVLASKKSGARRLAAAIALLKEVWVEENLSMNPRLTSSSAVHAERMKVLQTLLELDPGSSALYVEEIKSLALKETLEDGVLRIDRTRIFVNEAAITRWAERELRDLHSGWVLSRLVSQNSGAGADIRRTGSPESQSENFRYMSADRQYVSLVRKLFDRFLLDPSDGLDSYLSLRIRHGSLRGTLLGPVEEQGIYSDDRVAPEGAFRSRWFALLGASESDFRAAEEFVEDFTRKLQRIVGHLVEERVQIWSQTKPRGMVGVNWQVAIRLSLEHLRSEEMINFHVFLSTLYSVFWSAISADLDATSVYVRNVIKVLIRKVADELLRRLRELGSFTTPLVTAVTKAATSMQFQCDSISRWFCIPGSSADESFTLDVAVLIAQRSARNVYRSFPLSISISKLPTEVIRISSRALIVLGDVLFIIFENSWKHSGLSDDLDSLDVECEFDSVSKLLSVTVNNRISGRVAEYLAAGKLVELLKMREDDSVANRANREGGSGFAKLLRFSRYIDRKHCAFPLDFGVNGERWFTKIVISLVGSGGRYDIGH